MKRLLLAGIFTGLMSLNGFAQEDREYPFDLGFDYDGYPAGTTFTLRTTRAFTPHSALNLRLGINIARRKDFGEHSNEEGTGPGFSVGYRYYFKRDVHYGFFLDARVDFWFINIKWQDRDDMGAVIDTGTTRTFIIQPTAMAGYQYHFKDSPLLIEAGIAVGVEINVVENGEDVGEGAITLWHLGFSYRF